MRNKDTCGEIFKVLHEMVKGRKYLRSANLVPSLKKKTGLSMADIKACLGQLAREGKIGGKVTNKGEVYGNVEVLGRPPERELTETETIWRSVIEESSLADNVDNLVKCVEWLDRLSIEDMKTLMAGIERLIKDVPHLINEDPYNVSARYLLGSAKALEKIGGSIGVPFSDFNGRVSYIVAAGPRDPSCVLLIENLAPFEAFCESDAVNEVMGVATFGYSVSWSGVVKSIVTKNIKELVRNGKPPRFNDAIKRLPCYFWGDLDREGLNIYLHLKSQIPDLKFSGLYQPMINKIQNNEFSHPYTKLPDKSGQKSCKSNDGIVLKLASLCSERAIDQEVVDKSDIASLCSRELSFVDIPE